MISQLQRWWACLVDGDRVVWDSLAITEYLAEAHPQVWPAGVEARAWARSVCVEMHSGFAALRDQCTMNCGIRVRLNHRDALLQGGLRRIDQFWSDGLSRFGRSYLAGPAVTAVDAF